MLSRTVLARARRAGLLGRVEGLNLDRKAAMMDAFFQLRAAARANPRYRSSRVCQSLST